MEKAIEKRLRQDYGTSPPFFNWLNGFGRFTLDACATEKNAKVDRFLSPEIDGLTSPWGGPGERVFCNPGFSNVLPWLRKAHNETENGVVSFVITHAGLAAEWFREMAPLADKILLPSPRIQFVAPPGIKQSSNSRDNLIWIFTPWGDMVNSTEIVPVTWKW